MKNICNHCHILYKVNNLNVQPHKLNQGLYWLFEAELLCDASHKA